MPSILTPEPPVDVPQEQSPEFEIVMGGRHMASVGFLVLVAMTCAAGGAYWVGKASARVVEVPAKAAAEGPAKAAAVVEKPAPAPAPVAAIAEPEPEKPLFDKPMNGVIYLQIGSVEKGFATLIAHGARKMGYPAFVADGVNASVFRVLVGPFKTQEEYQKAKDAMEAIGMDNFTRRYQP